MIAAYQRISRADGDLGKDGKDKSNSIENQKELILRYDQRDGRQMQLLWKAHGWRDEEDWSTRGSRNLSHGK